MMNRFCQRVLLRIRSVAFLVFLGLLACPASVSAIDFQVHSRTIGDMYSHLRSSWDGEDPIERQRIHQLLSLNIFDMTNDGTNQVYFVSSLRVDADFGVTDVDQDEVPGMSRSEVALLYGYLEARKLMGWLDVRVGRQYEIDAIDMVLYDGMRVRAYTPWNLGFEALSGLESTQNMGFTSNPQTLDGTPGGPLLESGEYGAVEPRLVTGVGLFLHGLPYTHLDVAFRRIETLGDAVTLPSSSEGEVPEGITNTDAESSGETAFYRGEPGVNQQRIGVAGSQRVVEGLFLNSAASYDFYQSAVNEFLAGVRYRPVFEYELEGNYHYLIPSFDADSIWNVFSWRPMDRVEERARVYMSEDVWLHLGSYQSFFRSDASVTEEEVQSVVQDLGFTAGGTIRIQPSSFVMADVTTQYGYGGDQTFVDLGAGHEFLGGRFGVDGRLLMIVFEDEQQERLNGTMFGTQIGGFWQFSQGGRLSLMLEEASTQLQPLWLRGLAVVDLDFGL